MGKIVEKIADDLSLYLTRVNFLYRNQEITTECIQNHKGISFLGYSCGPFVEGNKYKLKFFIALPFIQNNILRIVSSEKCNNVDVQRYAISERDDQKLIGRNETYFLNMVKEFRYFTESEVEGNQKPKIDLDRYNSYTTNIIDSRLLKLLRLSKSELSLDDEQRLTYSEKKLYQQLYTYIKAWRDFFLSKI